MIYLDLDLDLSKALIMFMYLVLKLKLTTFSSLLTTGILSDYRNQIESLQQGKPVLFTQLYNYVMRLYNQNPDLDTFPGLVDLVSGLDTLPSLDTLIASSTCRQIENMGNNALDLSATPSTAVASISTPSTAVASISKPNREKKLHTCSYSKCNYETYYKKNLKIHMRKHTGERPYPCPYESCNYKAIQSSDLKIHMSTHTDERPFQCPYKGCDYKAKTASNLGSHKKHKHKHDQKQESN